MTKLIIGFILLLGLITIVMIISLKEFNSVSKIAPSTPDPLVLKNLTHLTPEMSVRLYIDGAIKGNEEMVSLLVTETPDSYSKQCETENVKIKSESILDDNLPKVVSKRNAQNLDIKSSRQTSEKFWELSNSTQKKSLAFAEAWYIHSTNWTFDKIKIVDREIFEDEGIVNVEYVSADPYAGKRKFLLKNVDGWKVFNTLSDSSDFSFTINKYYAKKRPPCKN